MPIEDMEHLPRQYDKNIRILHISMLLFHDSTFPSTNRVIKNTSTMPTAVNPAIPDP